MLHSKGGHLVIGETQGFFTGIPWTNYAHGPAVADGPHIDQKTARTVSLEERLFLDVSVTNVDVGAEGNDFSVNVVTDLRVLGSMRSGSGNRRNSSR